IVALDDAVAAAAGGELRGRLDQAARGFAADMAAAAWGRVALPGVADPVTVAHFVDPACPLLKHFFRRDHGDAVLAVSWTLAGGEWRHVISVQAECGLALPGLGAALEQAERKAEEGRTLRPGRERVQAGSGRFGGDVVSPWYDGRGHDFTIVDSPSVGAGETARCASLLSPARVWDVITSLYAVDKELPTP
ncbi:MAG TPA: hypothetical protein VK196_17625, partial [Magnetospirillum sp.]|nr:hypothetical protein [Magnetospirillum sp.]